MAENKTKPTQVKVADYVAAIEDEDRRADCRTLIKLMKKITGKPAKMWGPSIIGFGSIHYKYESGHEGDMPLVGFASRQREISLYLSCCEADRHPLLAKLGKHKAGKGCLYVRRLSDIDMKVLEEMIISSIADAKQRYGGDG